MHRLPRQTEWLVYLKQVYNVQSSHKKYKFSQKQNAQETAVNFECSSRETICTFTLYNLFWEA